MATYEYSDLLIVDTLASLPTAARAGFMAHTKDTKKFYFWNGSAWVTIGSGGGTSIRPVSIQNPRQTAGAYDDEFESSTLDPSWTRSASGTTVVSGTVHPWNTVTPDCVQDLNGTWPGWLLIQSDESSTQEVIYKKSWTATTDATFVIGMHFPSYSGAVSTGESAIKIRLTNSSDANEWVYAASELVAASGRHLRLQVNNNGALTTRTSTNTLGGYTGLGSEFLVLFKDGDVYNATVVGDYGGYVFELADTTKTGVTTFDRLEIVFATDNRTPSSIMGVDFIRVYDSLTWALKNP